MMSNAYIRTALLCCIQVDEYHSTVYGSEQLSCMPHCTESVNSKVSI